jgi:hypothetical protein
VTASVSLAGGILLGLGAALVLGMAAGRRALRRHLVHDASGWRIARGIGTPATHPMVRIALAPAYPLTNEHALYLFADDPRDRAPQWNALRGKGPLFRHLDGSRHYRIVSDRGPLAADWWSVTVYDSAGLMPGPAASCSVLDTGVAASADGTFVIDVASARPLESRNWLAVPPGAPFLIQMRIYGPAADLVLPRFEEA